MTETTIVYRHKMGRPPTLEDRAQRVGMKGFFEEVQKHDWVDKGLRSLKRFKVTYEVHEEPDNNYIQWTAILNEQQ
jgi:hypothetical protein